MDGLHFHAACRTKLGKWHGQRVGLLVQKLSQFHRLTFAADVVFFKSMRVVCAPQCNVEYLKSDTMLRLYSLFVPGVLAVSIHMYVLYRAS